MQPCANAQHHNISVVGYFKVAHYQHFVDIFRCEAQASILHITLKGEIQCNLPCLDLSTA